LYLFLGGGISTASPALINLLKNGSEELTKDSNHAANGPLLAALILTTLLPNFPVLSKIDTWLRSTF
jgi:hypothetical protein